MQLCPPTRLILQLRVNGANCEYLAECIKSSHAKILAILREIVQVDPQLLQWSRWIFAETFIACSRSDLLDFLQKLFNNFFETALIWKQFQYFFQFWVLILAKMAWILVLGEIFRSCFASWSAPCRKLSIFFLAVYWKIFLLKHSKWYLGLRGGVLLINKKFY